MRVLGLDPSSSKSGFAIVEDGYPVAIGLWKPTSREKSLSEKLISWGNFAKALILFSDIDMVAIEECGPQRNPVVFRALVRFEAVATYETARAGKILLLHKVSEARKIAVGKGNAPKADVFYEMKRRYPQFDWPHIDKGGDDQSDALAMALAAPRLAERR